MSELTRLLQVVSDMAARGLDIEDCDAVLNLELPSNASAYAHRAGRTGRLGRLAALASPVCRTTARSQSGQDAPCARRVC